MNDKADALQIIMSLRIKTSGITDNDIDVIATILDGACLSHRVFEVARNFNASARVEKIVEGGGEDFDKFVEILRDCRTQLGSHGGRSC